MSIDELLVEVGIDTNQASKIKDLILLLGDASKKIADQANNINSSLDGTNDKAVKGAEDAGKKAGKAEAPLNKLKLLALGVSASIGYVTGKVIGFLNSSIAGARELSLQKGLLFNISKKELKQADEYQAATRQTGISIDSIKTKIALNLAPALTKATRGFNSFLSANKSLIAEGMTKVVNFLLKFVQVIVNAIRFVDKIISSTIGWKATLLILVGVFAVFKKAMIGAFITNPITLVFAAIAGLLLLVDDLMTYLDGGESMFGDFWKPAVEWVRKVITWFKKFYTDNKIIFDTLASIWMKLIGGMLKIVSGFFSYIFNALKFLVGLFTGDTDMMKQAWNGMVAGLMAMWDGLEDYLSAFFSFLSLMWRGVLTAVKNIWSSITSVISNGFNKAKQYATSFTNQIKEIFTIVLDLITSPFKAAFTVIKGLFGIGDSDVESYVDNLGNSFAKAKDIITKPFKAAFDWVKDYYDKTIGKLAGVWDSVKGFFGSSEVEATLRTAESNDTINPSNSLSTTNSKSDTTINQSPITINNTITSSSPEKTAQMIGGSVENGIKQANYALVNTLGNGG